MRKPQTDWFVFQPGEDEATVHASYRLAVRDAQYRGCTDSRPQKLIAGQYELFGCRQKDGQKCSYRKALKYDIPRLVSSSISRNRDLALC